MQKNWHTTYSMVSRAVHKAILIPVTVRGRVDNRVDADALFKQAMKQRQKSG